MTSLIHVQSSAADAQHRQERIRLVASTVREGIEKVAELVTEARESGDAEALGYQSWTAYLADTLGSEPMRLNRAARREVVALLAGEGLSTRAIAPIVGVDQKTVSNDLSGEEYSSPEPRAITGMDGKTYTPRPPANVGAITGEVLDAPTVSTPRAAPRRALTDQFFDAFYDLTKVTERVVRLSDDDRFPQNAEKVAAKHRNDLIRARDALQGVINRLPQP